MSEHPSFLALDRHHLAADPALAAHLAACAECRGYLETLRPPAATPAWLPASPRRPRRLWILGVPLAVAAAAVVALWPRPQIREKGAPALQVHVKRGEVVAPWDGQPLRAGDRMRLQIAPAGYRFVSVATGDAQVLYAAAISPSGSTLLPTSFRVDGADPEETLDVVLAAEPVPAAAHRRPEPPRGAWRRRITFPTEKTR